MQTTKRVVITLDDGDEIEIMYRGHSFIVEADSERHGGGPTLHFPAGAEMIYDPREEPEPQDFARRLMEHGQILWPNGETQRIADLPELEHALSGSLMEEPLPRNASIYV